MPKSIKDSGRAMKRSEWRKIEVEEGGDNVFADIGLPNPDEALAKADVAREINRIVTERGLTQLEAGRLLGIGQPRVSQLKRGRLGDFSLEKLIGFAKALGQPVRYNNVTPDVYRGFGFPGAEDLGNMFQYKRDFEAQFCGARDLALARQLNPALQTFAVWLAANKDKIPVEASAAGA